MRFFALFVTLLLVSASVLAQDHASAAAVSGVTDKGWLGIASAIAITFAAAGCGIGQGLSAYSALQGMARNPAMYNKLFTTMIVAFAIIESLAIYALVIAFLIKP